MGVSSKSVIVKYLSIIGLGLLVLQYMQAIYGLTKNRRLFKPGACRPQAGMCLVSRNHFHAAKVCVCVCA